MVDLSNNIAFDLVIKSNLKIFWNWLQVYLNDRTKYEIRGSFNITAFFIKPMFYDPTETDYVANHQVEFLLITHEDVNEFIRTTKELFDSDEWEIFYENKAIETSGKIEVIRISDSRIQVTGFGFAYYFWENLVDIGTYIINTCELVNILKRRGKNDFLIGVTEALYANIDKNVPDSNKKVVSKRGRKTYSDERIINALKKWDEDTDRHIKLQDFLVGEFGLNEQNYPNVVEQTFHGWRRRFKKKGLYP